MSLTFRWLGNAAVELNADGQVLAIDPFFTRPSLLQLLRPLISNIELAEQIIPQCRYVLVTHAHYDHLLDVPAVLRNTGADAYGSPNTCQIIRMMDIPESQMHVIHPGDVLELGAFRVEVVAGRHSRIPFSWIFNGSLRTNMQPPLWAQDYRMDICLGYSITVMGSHLLVCAATPQPADVLFAVAQEPKAYYLGMFKGVRPKTLVPIHWDDFTRSLKQPLRRFTRPGRMPLQKLSELARQCLPGVHVIIPELFKEYSLGASNVELD